MPRPGSDDRNEMCEYSHEGRTSYASGGETPPPPVFNAQDLVTRVVEDLGRAWEAGMELTVQMLAQEIQKKASMYTGNQARVLQLAAEGCRGYVVEGFQVGIVLSPRWSMWLNALITDSGRGDGHLQSDGQGQSTPMEGRVKTQRERRTSWKKQQGKGSV